MTTRDLVAVVDQVRFEAHVWGKVNQAVQAIVEQVDGLRLPKENFDPNFFAEAIRGHNDVAKKVGDRCTEGVDVTKKIQVLLEGFTEHYRRLAVSEGQAINPPRTAPPMQQGTPTQERDNLRSGMGLPSIQEMEGHLKSLRDGAAELARKIVELRTKANQTLHELETTMWRWFMPGLAALIRAIREVTTRMLDFCSGYLQIVAWVLQQARLCIAMYDDSLKWVEVRAKANEIQGWLAPAVLNPERAAPAGRARRAWHGEVEAAYAAAIPGQTNAASAIGLMGLVTAGSVMGCFGAQVYVFSNVSSVLIDVTTAIGELIVKIVARNVTIDWYDLFFSRLPTWAKAAKETLLAALQAEATSKFNAQVFRMLVIDNSAFTYRADLRLYDSLSQLPQAWPDPTRAGVDWPREVRNQRGDLLRWEVSREVNPRPRPDELIGPRRRR